ncbi:MAG: exopolyphosphatase [Gammaproteobacteria bacterium]
MSSGIPTPPPPAAADLPSPSSQREGGEAATSVADQVLAAIDLGSNSFHMVVARLEHGRLSVLDRIREMVRLGAGLDENGHLSQAAADRALDCLRRFRERLQSLNAESVRAVGTNTLRRARDRDAFLARASAALGHPIDVISGVEEARLVYLGAAHDLPADADERLVVDIGGGSTELIVGRGYDAERLESLYMGCVSLSSAFFPEGRVTDKRFRLARIAARQELEPVAPRFRGHGVQRAFGTSGTIRATARMLSGDDNPSGIVTRRGLDRLQKQLVKSGDLRRRRPGGLGEQRAPVYPGGLAILIEVFEALGIESLMAVDSALREGLLYDMLGRMTDEDARERSVRSLESRFHVDTEHASRVESTALDIYGQLAADWDLSQELPKRLLRWAARLHEIGLDIAHAKYQFHGAYLLRNADLAGFSTGEQLLLSTLVSNHRRKIRQETLEALPAAWRNTILRLAVVLRLAVLINRSRSPDPQPVISISTVRGGLRIGFPEGWLDAHPLTRADLQQEKKYLSAAGVRLRAA